MWIGSFLAGSITIRVNGLILKNSTLVMILKIFGRRVREFCESNNDGTVWIGTEDKGLFHFYPKVERLKNSHILLFIKMFMVYVWTVMICG